MKEEEKDAKDIDKFINSSDSKSTLASNKFAGRMLARYNDYEDWKPEKLSAKELDTLLCEFFMNIMKVDGSMYELDVLSTVHRALQR